MRRKITLAFGLFSLLLSYAQSGGDNIYDFLNLTPSAKYTALGGQQISLNDGDINAVYHNPAMLSSEMDNQFAINYNDYLSDISFSTVNYARTFSNIGNFAAGLQYFNYNEFEYADETGYRSGETFKGMDYCIALSYSRSLIDSTLRVGVTFKTIFSDLENYFSYGVAADLGVNYISKSKLFSAGLVFKNMGMQLKTYDPSQTREKLPFEIQAGLTKRLAHAPFRLSVLTTHIEDWNLYYKTAEQKKEDTDPETGIESQDKSFEAYGDKFFRHIIVGLDFIPSKSLVISAGYNYKRRKELMLVDAPGMIGFTFGASLNLRKFSIAYGRQAYHVSSSTNTFSLRLNLNEFGKNL